MYIEEQNTISEEENRAFTFLNIYEDDYKTVLNKMDGIGVWKTNWWNRTDQVMKSYIYKDLVSAQYNGKLERKRTREK